MTYKAGPEATILPPSKHFPGNFQAHMGKPQVHMVQDVNRTFNIMGNRKPTGLDMFGPLFGWVSNFQQKSFLAICLMHLCHIQFWMGVQFAPSHHQPCGWGMFFSFAILVALVLLATRLSHWALTEHAYSRRLVLWITSSFFLWRFRRASGYLIHGHMICLVDFCVILLATFMLYSFLHVLSWPILFTRKLKRKGCLH